MYDNDINHRTKESAAGVDSWRELLSHFGIQISAIDTTSAHIICPRCNESATFIKTTQYPKWKCDNKCQLHTYDSFVGLIRAKTKANGSEMLPGLILGEIEKFLLEKRATNGKLPDTTIAFGKHKGKQCNQIPKQYLRWLLGAEIVKDELAQLIALHLNVDLPPKEKLIAF